MIVVTVLDELTTAEAVEDDDEEPELDDDDALLGCASAARSSETVSMNAMVGPAMTELVA